MIGYPSGQDGAPLGTTRCIPQEKFPRKPYNKSFINQVCSVKMAGYWPPSFFASLWTSTSSRSINTQKKERGQYLAILTEQTWSIKDLLHGFWGNLACGIQRVVPSGQDRSILPARIANHSARFRSSCPLEELAI